MTVSRALRRIFRLGLVLIAGALVLGWRAIEKLRFGEDAYWLGWLLFGLCLFFLLFNVRKAAPFLPLGRAETWLELHVYGGVFAVLVFLAHIDFREPNGTLETLLAILFVLLTLSGLVGLWLERTIPPRLAKRGESVIFERIPRLRNGICEKVDKLVERSMSETHSTTIADFHVHKLHSFLGRPRDFWYHVFSNPDHPAHRIQREFRLLDRYLNDDERRLAREIQQAVLAKVDLDCHYTGNLVLKGWLFVHVPLAYSFMILALVHLGLAQAYGT